MLDGGRPEPAAPTDTGKPRRSALPPYDGRWLWRNGRDTPSLSKSASRRQRGRKAKADDERQCAKAHRRGAEEAVGGDQESIQVRHHSRAFNQRKESNRFEGTAVSPSLMQRLLPDKYADLCPLMGWDGVPTLRELRSH